MVHWVCTGCHHEWDGDQTDCDWCGAPGCDHGEDPQWRNFWAHLPVVIAHGLKTFRTEDVPEEFIRALEAELAPKETGTKD